MTSPPSYYRDSFDVFCGKIDVFNKFKDNKGNFKESLVHDMRGMLCLYEASHQSVHGEDILDEALKFCTTKLQLMVVGNDLIPSDLATQVRRALKQPIRKCLPKVEARHYFSIYKESASCNEVLLNFAKLNFNILQKQHQMEICHLLNLILMLGGWNQATSSQNGKTVVSKEVLEVVDNVNLSITFKLIGGPLLELYKNVKFIVESTPKGEGGLVRNIFEYEKLSADVPDPNAMLQLAVEVTKEIDAHLI
ncbi:(-)-germacrene D synthase [Morella rubra]|uniref:(-)-germacrene D synthase n=1 Tax=Morella rubra TaxID=262757 RepID=A0A6A1VQX4_9ROSI|nr:(-)-germacrene D synthase [Morella rubra]